MVLGPDTRGGRFCGSRQLRNMGSYVVQHTGRDVGVEGKRALGPPSALGRIVKWEGPLVVTLLVWGGHR